MPIIANWFYWKMMPLVLKILSQICFLAFKKSWILSKISQYVVSDIKSCMVRCTNRKEVKPLNNISYFWTCLIINNNFLKKEILVFTLLEMCESIMKLWTCFSALVSSSFLATTATTNTVQPAPCRSHKRLNVQIEICIQSQRSLVTETTIHPLPHHYPCEKANAASTVSVGDHISIPDRQEGDGDHPQGLHVVATQVPVVVVSAEIKQSTHTDICAQSPVFYPRFTYKYILVYIFFEPLNLCCILPKNTTFHKAYVYVGSQSRMLWYS